MIKFFRKLRQNLLSENKFSRYLLYALGEIVLVVIGILIALQINNWNEARKQNAYEDQLLLQLKKDLEFNVKDIQLNISLQKLCINSCDVLIRQFDQNLPYNDSLIKYFARSGLWTKAILNKGAYGTLKSSGLDIITNYELRELVFNIYEGDLVWINHMENLIINQIEEFRINKAEYFFKKWEATELEDGQLVDGEVLLLDYDKFSENNSFQYMLYGVKTNSEILQKIVENYLNDHLRAIELIDRRREKHN